MKKCKAHHLAEVVSREKEWHLSRTFVDDGYQRAIVIIDQLREEWREAFDRPFEMFGVLVTTFLLTFIHSIRFKHSTTL